MKILVTGHSGLVGSNLVVQLKKMGHNVLGVSRTNRYKFPEARTVDLTNAEQTLKIFEEFQPEIVFHLAANGSEARSQISPIDMVTRNLLLSTNVVRAAVCTGVKKFIYASSISVYGDALVPYSEFGQEIPKDIYGVNKLAFEQVLKIMSDVYGFEYVILRPHNIYGPGQNMADPTKNVIALFMRRVLEGDKYTLYGNGEMYRAFSYVDDVVAAFITAMKEIPSGTVFNVGSINHVSIKEMSDLLTQVTGITPTIEMKPMRPQEMKYFIADHSLQPLLLRYQETPLQVGLQKTWEWVKKRPLPNLIKMEDEICLPR